jgi:hypothetical protein
MSRKNEVRLTVDGFVLIRAESEFKDERSDMPHLSPFYCVASNISC